MLCTCAGMIWSNYLFFSCFTILSRRRFIRSTNGLIGLQCQTVHYQARCPPAHKWPNCFMCTPFSTLLLSSSVLILFYNNIQPDSSLETNDMVNTSQALPRPVFLHPPRENISWIDELQRKHLILYVAFGGLRHWSTTLLYTWTMIWKFIVFICEALGSQFEQVIEWNLFVYFVWLSLHVWLTLPLPFQKIFRWKGFWI